METDAALWDRNRLTLSQPIGDPENLVGLTDSVRDTTSPVSSGKKKSICDRFPEARIDRRKALLDSHQTTNIPRVTIGVPAGGVSDHERPKKIIFRIEQTQDDDGVIWYDVAVSGKFIGYVRFLHPCSGRQTIPVSASPHPNIIDYHSHRPR